MIESFTPKNKNKIWLLGDSYVAVSNDTWLEKNGAKSWTKMVTEKFPEYAHENLAFAGSSLDFLYLTYERSREDFKSGDIVIMSLTNIERILLRDERADTLRFLRPVGIVSFVNGKFVKKLEKESPLSVDHPSPEYFVSDLFNPETHKAKVNLFLNSLQYDAMTKGIKIIVLPIADFPFLDTENKDHITLGKTSRDLNLCIVSRKQMEVKFNIDHGPYFYVRPECQEYDMRLANHLTLRNNEILANKVIRNIKTDEPIDLTTEWEYT